MPNNKELFQRFSKIDDYSGGTLFGKTFFGEGVVSYTNRYGDFVYTNTIDHDLIAGFPDIGLNCVYDIDCSLTLMSINLKAYLRNVFKGERDVETKQSEISHKMLAWLEEANLNAILTADPGSGVIEWVVFDEKNRVISRKKSQPCNFDDGLDGDIKMGEMFLPFFIEKHGDELVVGFGEIDADDMVADALAISTRVDYVDDIIAGMPNDLQRLAGKILLN